MMDWDAVPMRERQARVQAFALAWRWVNKEAVLRERLAAHPFEGAWINPILSALAMFQREGIDVSNPKLTVREMFPKSYLSGEILASQHPKGLPVKVVGNPVQEPVFNRQENKEVMRWVLPVQAFAAPGKPMRLIGVKASKTGAMEMILGVELAESIERAIGLIDVFEWVGKFIVLEPKKGRGGKVQILARAVSAKWLGMPEAQSPAEQSVRDTAHDDHEKAAADLASGDLPHDDEMALELHEAEAGEGDESDTDTE